MSGADNKKKRRPQRSRGTTAGWRCKDCGKQTPYYRCPSCKAKWLAKHGLSPYEAMESYEDSY